MFNEAKVFFIGDAARGLQYVPFARKKLFSVKAMGLENANKVFQIDDVEIWVKTTPQADKIFIVVPSTSYLSCFLDTYPILPPQKLDISGTPIPYTPFQIGTQTIKEERYLIPPATTITPGLYGIRTKKVPDPLTITRTLPVEPGAPIPDQTSIPAGATYPVRFREVFDHFLPSKFTGLMRGVMQVAFATFQWTNLAQVKVDYHFGNSYGVIQNPATKGYYLLRITADSVYYIPAKFRTSTTGVAPNLQDVLQLISLDNTKAVKIGTIPPNLGTSWSTEIGWAFSYTTPEASIVYESGRFIGSQNYITTELLTLTFGFDPVTFLPTSATLLRGTPQIMWTTRFTTDPNQGDYGLFNIPIFGIPYPETGPARLYGQSVDFGRGRPVPWVRGKPFSDYAVSGIPVYVYYTKAGKQLCTYTYTPDDTYFFDIPGVETFHQGGSTTKEVSWITTIGTSLQGGFTDINNVSTTAIAIGFGSTSSGSIDDAGGNVSNWVPLPAISGCSFWYISNGVSSGTFPPKIFQTWSSGFITSIQYSLDSDGTDQTVYSPMTYNTVALTQTWVNANNQQVVFDTSLTLPLTDREAALIYTRTVTTGFNKTTQTFPDMSTKDLINSSEGKEEHLMLFGGFAPITLDAKAWGFNNLMLNMHPQPQFLDYKCTTSAYDTENVAYQTLPGSIGAPIVIFEGIEYAIENSLYGWVGVV